MASVRLRNDKKLSKLKQESKKLHAEVEALEDALMLHQRYKHEDNSSVRGILRKEIGGSIWQHGGSGKLHSYRTTHDLEEPEKNIVDQAMNKRRQRRNKQYESNQKENERVRTSSKDGQPVVTSQHQNELETKSVGISNKEYNGLESKGQSSNKNSENHKNLVTNESRTDSNLNTECDKFSILKSKVIEKASAGVIHRKQSKLTLDSHKGQPKSQLESNKTAFKPQSEAKTKLDSQTNKVDQTKKNNLLNVKSIENPNKPPAENVSNDEKLTYKPPTSKLKQTNIKPSQALERSRDSEVLKILSMSSNQRKNASTEDVSSMLQKSQKESSNSSIDIALSKCDPHVKDWISGLGLIEEEKYIKLFSENEIDMNEVPQLTALQLNEMGITAFGALNKILRGIKELKQKSKPEKKNSMESSSPKPLLSSHEHKNVLKSENDVRHSRVMDSDICRSQTYDEHSNSSNEPRTNLRRSRSFVQPSSTSKNAYSFDRKSNERLKFESNDVNTDLPSATDDVNIVTKQNHIYIYTTSQLQGNEMISPMSGAENIDSITKDTLPKEDKIKTLRKRSNSPARRPASSPARRKNKPAEKPVDSDIPSKKKCDNSGPSNSLSRPGSDGSSSGKKTSIQRPASAKSKNIPVLWPRGKSAQTAEKKAKEGVAAAAKRFNEKQKQMSEKEEKHTKAKKIKKVQRDEMAARHEQRQQIEIEDEIDEGRIDVLDKAYEKERVEISELDKDISKLISVTVLDTNNRDDDITELRQREDRPQRSRARSSRLARQSINNPVFIGADLPDNLMPTVKGKSSHTSRQSEVRTIESQIEALQSKALSGEMVTMDLVKGLQQRLEEIEQQIKDAKPPKNRPRHRLEPRYHVSMSMRGKDLTNEMEKEKDARQARSSELSRVSDPLRSIEIDSEDIMFDATDLIGEGTFSKVYHGVCMGTEVAIKQLKIPLTTHDQNYFAAEVSLLKELHHPRVVLLLGVCTSDKLPVMVLEFMAKGSLYYYLHDPKCESMDHAEYYRVSHDIALGMNYLHQHKPQVLHLDLKSTNVLLDSSGRAKIADFGFSKFRHDADMKASKASKKKGTCCSPSWMAPELLETGEITTKADVYSFGIILWEMLTRSYPYEGCSVFQILERVRLNKRPEIPAGSPPELSSFIQRCWDQNTAKRPAFKDVILQLDKLAFPPDWRALFKEAGIPSEALEDVQSARTIISLVNNTVDLENVKTMMEDIKHSNDAIKASHDLTRESHAFTSQSNDFMRQSNNSLSQSQNFMVQSRKPQEQMNSSLRKSLDVNLTPGRHSYDNLRHSREPLLTRKSYNSSFSSRSKKFDDEENYIEEDIEQVDDIRDSYDFKFNTKFSESFDYEQNFTDHSRDKLFQKGENSYRDVKHSMRGEDTTAEYLNYLKASCEILSPSPSSPPISRKHSDSVKDFLFPDSQKSDTSGAVIETMATIPRAKSPTITLRKSDNKLGQENAYSSKESHNKDKLKATSHTMPMRMSHEMLLQEIQKSKTDFMQATTPKKLNDSSIQETQRSNSQSTMQQVQENLNKEIQNLNPDSRKDSLSRRSYDLTVKKSHDDLNPDLRKDSLARMSHDKLMKKSHEDMNSDLRKDSPSMKSFELPVRKSHDVSHSDLPNDSSSRTSYDLPIRKSHDMSQSNDSSLRKSHDSLIQEVRSSVGQLRKDDNFHPLSRSRESESVNLRKSAQDISCLKADNSLSKGDNSNSKSQKELDSLLNKSSSSECDENSDQAESNEQFHLDKSVENSDIPVTNVVHKSLNENMLEEMKNLHSKLRSQKSEHVEEIKNLHTKLRGGKPETSNSKVPELGIDQEKVPSTENKALTEDNDSIENVDIKDDLDNLSVDSLDLNDSITDDNGQEINQKIKNSENKKRDEIKGNTKPDSCVKEVKQSTTVKSGADDETLKNTNQSASSSENNFTGKNVNALPDLRSSLNMEIAQKYSSLKQLKKETVKKKQMNENLNDGKLKTKKESEIKTIKAKSNRKPKAPPEKEKNDDIAIKETNTHDPPEVSCTSIEAWVEKKDEKKQRQRKKSNLTSHPPPIVIPDEPPVHSAPPIPPPPPPIPTEPTVPPTPPPIPVVQTIPPPPPIPILTEQANLSNDANLNVKKKKTEIPAAKLSNQEAKVSNTSKSKLSKGDDSDQLMVQSADLREQKEVLQSISKPHPNQLQDLSQVNKQTYTSIAEILKRANWTDLRMAVFSRREAMGEDYSPSPSVASSWSFVDD